MIAEAPGYVATQKAIEYRDKFSGSRCFRGKVRGYRGVFMAEALQFFPPAHQEISSVAAEDFVTPWQTALPRVRL
jgi:hypothetical protein